ncbi:hypothetical protein OG884_21655 [Streptosporangium sp. NBC_01755]|uniref:lectin-like domain-containing protein n=1 Tax=Streptosporangium sp. NBC_01755 TaxID=2975949 RepID=UPI002DDA08D2|nr:hypothetical protein [Streptosporangium sp. NBC_01755]WSC97497.1 hypothetical protein OG884_21655 [Streptosporangium sp. NBC_01755]
MVMAGGALPRCGRTLSKLLVLSMTVGALSVPATTATASAAGTVVFNQPFRNNTANGAGAVVLPSLPSGSSGSNYACLTASGNTGTGVLQSCATNTDSQGSGKLRLTNATTNKTGGLFGAVSVPASQGLDVTFNTYQYGGGGADGITFVLAAVDPANPKSPANIGQSGGALGYSGTSSVIGLAYGYLGIGLDVYGNFSVIWRGTPGVHAREETTVREGRQGPSGAVTGRPSSGSARASLVFDVLLDDR